LFYELVKQGLNVERQKAIPVILGWFENGIGFQSRLDHWK
jgi:hypothetical protein